MAVDRVSVGRGREVAVDKLSVGRGKGVAVETTPCCRIHADNERDRRHAEMRTYLKDISNRIGRLSYRVIERLLTIR
jgi:hypothetical protein